MTLQELRYLVAVADEGHFGRAAKACFVSQPTLSAGIKKLEETLDVTLFERTRRRVFVTDRGAELVEQARRVLEEADRLEALAGRAAGPLSGRFRLGAIPTVAPYLLPRVVPKLHSAFPDLRLQLREAQTAVCLSELRAGRLDGALLSPPAEDEGLEVIALYREAFFLAAPQGHRLLRRARVRAGDLVDEPMLVLDEGHCLRDQTLEVCKRPATRAQQEFGGASLETLKSMVAAGAGCTLLPSLAARETDGLERRPFSRPSPHRVVSLYSRTKFPRPEAIRALAKFLRNHLPEGVEPA